MNTAQLICSQLGLNQNQLNDIESIVLLETLLFLAEERIKIELD